MGLRSNEVTRGAAGPLALRGDSSRMRDPGSRTVLVRDMMWSRAARVPCRFAARGEDRDGPRHWGEDPQPVVVARAVWPRGGHLFPHALHDSRGGCDRPDPRVDAGGRTHGPP